jgi:hypothetical protein
MAYTKYSLTPADNNAAPPNGAPEGMLPSAVNDTMRDMMAQIRDVGDGIRGGTYTMTAPIITGGSINGAAIGASSASTGAFSTLSATGVTTVQAGSVSSPAITTSGDTNTGIYFPAADTIAFTEGGVESMRINASGQVGIGSSSPTTPLYVAGTISTDAGYFQCVGGNPSNPTGTTPSFYNQSGVGSTISGYQLAIRTGGTPSEAVRINESGNVGIGTSSPSQRLDVVTSSGFAAARFSNGTGTVVCGVDSSNNGYLSTESNSPFTFLTNGSERMRIDSSGNLLVGTTSNAGNERAIFAYADASNNGLGIRETTDASGTSFLVFRASNSGVCGSVSRVTTTNAVVYNTTSDERLKSNIADASPVLNKLMDVKVRQFDWTVGDLHQDAGFIAQELEPILSGIVTKGKTEEDIWQLDYARLTPYLVKAIQEQQALITNLTTRLTALENS